MDRVVAHVRRVGLASVAMLSVSVGVGTIWVVANPEVIGRIPTWILLGVLGLMVLPAAAVGALVVDRRAILAARPVSETPDAASQSPAARDAGARLVAAMIRQGQEAAERGEGLDHEIAGRGIAHEGPHERGSDVLRHRHHRSAVVGQD